MVLGVAALLIFGVVLAARAAFGTDASADAGDPAGASVPADVSVDPAAPAGSANVDSAATTEAPTTTAAEPEETYVPSAEHPASVYIAGDSDAGAFGPSLMSLLDDTGVVDTTLDYKVSSGLARPDFYDWPAHLRQVIPKANPQVVVVTFGGNDAQDILIDGRATPWGRPEW